MLPGPGGFVSFAARHEVWTGNGCLLRPWVLVGGMFRSALRFHALPAGRGRMPCRVPVSERVALLPITSLTRQAGLADPSRQECPACRTQGNALTGRTPSRISKYALSHHQDEVPQLRGGRCRCLGQLGLDGLGFLEDLGAVAAGERGVLDPCRSVVALCRRCPLQGHDVRPQVRG